MLLEIRHVRQIPGEGQRRWFTCKDLDSILWFEDQELIAWQFCYDKEQHEHALSWRKGMSFTHMAVDNGEGSGGMAYKSTPLLREAQAVYLERVEQLFAQNCAKLPADLAHRILKQIQTYPQI